MNDSRNASIAKKPPKASTCGSEKKSEQEATFGKSPPVSKLVYAIILLPFILLIILALSLFACTVSFTSVHTQGVADDVVDEEQTSTPNVSPNINIPLSNPMSPI